MKIFRIFGRSIKNAGKSIFRNLRKEISNSNTPIKCKLEFNDTTTEEYNFIISSVSLTSDKINPTTASYELALY